MEYGAADIGIAGRDVLLETSADVLQPLDLKFGYCKIAVAGPKMANPLHPGEGGANASPKGEPQEKARWVTLHSRRDEVSANHTELLQCARDSRWRSFHSPARSNWRPLIGLADRIVDLVETGRTLKENGLEVLEVIAESSQAAHQSRRLPDQARRSRGLIQALEKVVA